jgi:hypothetical protein
MLGEWSIGEKKLTLRWMERDLERAWWGMMRIEERWERMERLEEVNGEIGMGMTGMEIGRIWDTG